MDYGSSGAFSILTPESGSGRGNEVVVKKRIGRPRKYALKPVSSVALSDPSTATPQKKRGRSSGSERK